VPRSQWFCNKTGWPIDINIKFVEFGQLFEGHSGPNHQNMGLYFFLQEEMCFNLFTGKEEPLALQKLMMKHVKNMNNQPVTYLAETEFRSMVDEAEQMKDHDMADLRSQITNLLRG